MQDLQLLTCDEVAQFLRVSPETVRQLAAAGELPGREVGRAWRFPRTAIEAHFLGALVQHSRHAESTDHPGMDGANTTRADRTYL